MSLFPNPTESTWFVCVNGCTAFCSTCDFTANCLRCQRPIQPIDKRLIKPRTKDESYRENLNELLKNLEGEA